MARDDPRAIDPRPVAPRGSAWPVPLILALSLAGVAAAALWLISSAKRSQPLARRPHDPRLLTIDRPIPAGGRFESDPYSGPQACAECHPGEAALFSRSGHASTLRSAGRVRLAARLDGTTVPDPDLPGVLWSYRFRDGQLHLSRKEGNHVEDCILEYAFGSGRHATTFVSVIDPKVPAILEHRLTHFTEDGALGITPGHKVFPRPPGLTFHGKIQMTSEALMSVRCHTTELSARDDQQIDEETMIPNVSCERCHGPGRAHIAAARRGASESELALPLGPDRWTSESLMKQCGACHRHPSEAEPGMIHPDDTKLVRFQPVGIIQSRCYSESGGAFSCVTCHDPHARVSTDRAWYESVCLSCHARRVSTNGPAVAQAGGLQAVRNPCPVSPRDRCVDCHMPRVDAGGHLLFADHWIRVRRDVARRIEREK